MVPRPPNPLPAAGTRISISLIRKQERKSLWLGKVPWLVFARSIHPMARGRSVLEPADATGLWVISLIDNSETFL